MNCIKLIGIIAFTTSLTACGVQTNEELSQLKIEEYAVQVCHSMVDSDIEQLEVMFSDRAMKNFLNRAEVWKSEVAHKITCDVVSTRERKRGLEFRFKSKAAKSLRVTIAKNNGIYQVANI